MGVMPNPEVEAFLAQNPVEQHAASRLRGLPPHQQRLVLERGTLNTARDPSAVLITRIRDAVASGSQGPVTHTNPEVEDFLQKNRVEQHAAVRLRQLNLQQQKLVMERGSLNSARDPSAVLVSRCRDAVAGKLQPMPAAANPDMEAHLPSLPAPGMGMHSGPPPPSLPHPCEASHWDFGAAGLPPPFAPPPPAGGFPPPPPGGGPCDPMTMAAGPPGLRQERRRRRLRGPAAARGRLRPAAAAAAAGRAVRAAAAPSGSAARRLRHTRHDGGDVRDAVGAEQHT